MVVVSRKHRRAVRGQRRQHRPVLPRHGFHRCHELQVLALGVVDQGHRGPSQISQVGDFTRVVHAQLNHGQRVPCPQAKQGERHTDVVVEVALSRQYPIGTARTFGASGSQDGGDHLRDGGFAVGAGHGDQRQRELRTPACGQRAQRQRGVGHLDATEARCGQATMGDGSSCATGLDLGQEIIGVKAHAFEGDEQIALSEAARIGVDAAQRCAAVAHQGGVGDAGQQPVQRLLQRHHGAGHAAPPAFALLLMCVPPPRNASAASAWVWSLKGCLTPATSW